jgi:acetone carboxylase gamma subunit
MTRSVVEGNLNLNNERIYFTSIEKDNERHHHNLVIFQFSFKHMNRILFSILGVLFILHFQAQNMDPITIQGKTKKCKTELIKISNKTGEFTFGINKDGSVIGNMSALEG